MKIANPKPQVCKENGEIKSISLVSRNFCEKCNLAFFFVKPTVYVHVPIYKVRKINIKVRSHHTLWKNEKFSLTEKNFVNSTLVISLVKQPVAVAFTKFL